MKPTRIAAAAAALVLSSTLIACSSAAESGAGEEGKSVVVDASFDIKTLDPARSFEPTGSIVNHVLYETLLTFDGDDVSVPVDGLASYELSDEDRVVTLTMKGDSTFSDGSPVTVDDVVFSLNRVKEIAGNPSFMLDGVEVEKTSDTTLTLTSAEANPTLVYLLPNPSLGIVNSKVLQENGGSADSEDTAESFLNETSAGSGPFVLESFDATSQIVLTANPEFGGEASETSRIVLRNVSGETQKLNVQSGESQIAIDLNPDQIAELNPDELNIETASSRYTAYMMLNQDPAVSAVTSDPKFTAAVKSAIDYDKILALGGDGAERPGGLVPTSLLGSLPAEDGNSLDLDAAKALLGESGYAGETVTLHYANDTTVAGIALEPIALSVQSDLKALGVDVALAPAPEATELDNYRNGKEEMGIWSWGADFPDPSNYFVFLPGENVGSRAMWQAGASQNIDDLRAAAVAASGEDERGEAFQNLQVALNEEGPFIPLLQPALHIVADPAIASVDSNLVWTIDLSSIRYA
ncbi:ABC transporter substrate-binding protein [Leucobacter sp. L43]|uniref:ABC transporter substrate-binding protein n=1 Tax=Leucobacter sp. L43 TaxID=2798040 RepID=UPI001907FB2A|nr:ABC transporter substrate-binding protein [Leucobacter sp. L43]